MTDPENLSETARRQCERTAETYYAFRRKGPTANDLVEVPAMRRLIGEVRGKRVLDAGCGFGPLAIHCARRGAEVTAVDISPTMIQLARREAAAAGVEIDFRILDATDLAGLAADSYDLAISGIAVSFNAPLLFREIARVLKPRGIFCFSEVHPLIGGGRRAVIEGETGWFVDHYFARGIQRATNVFGKIDPADEDYEWQWQHYTLEDYCAALRAAGFLIDALREPLPDPTTEALDPRRYVRACRYPLFVLIRAIKERLPEDHPDRLRSPSGQD